MEEKINIAEKLKDAPKNTKVWSRNYGEVIFEGIVDKDPESCGYLSFKDIDNGWFYTDGYGRISKRGECIILPCKGGSWENFEPWWKHQTFQPLEKVLVKSGVFDFEGNKTVYIWALDFYSHFDKRGNRHITVVHGPCEDDSIIPYNENEGKVGEEVKAGEIINIKQN